MYLLFPGRHHILTSFQEKYFHTILNTPGEYLKDVFWNCLPKGTRIEGIVWAVTSSNRADTRRNPLSWARREWMIQAFASWLEVPSYVYHIDDIWYTDNFANYVIKKIAVESEWHIVMSPENTIVWCSTPQVISMYDKLWYQILPFELENLQEQKYWAMVPWEIIKHIAAIATDENWIYDSVFLQEVSQSTQKIYKTYNIWQKLHKIFADPLLHGDGDITKTRDYNTYVRAFDNWAERKYDLTKKYIQSGKIVDIWCCTWSYIRELTHDQELIESDFYGIEVASRLYKECLNRKEEWYFHNDNVFFYHRNIATDYIFPQNFIDTFTTFSLTHEIESYQGREALSHFISMIYDQTTIWGRWINVDVVWPENPDKIVYAKLATDDGIYDYQEKIPYEWQQLVDYLSSLSTYAKFLRFAKDFRQQEWYMLQYEKITIDWEKYIKARLQDIYEFMTKKDYVDNWYSEMHETFWYWDYNNWSQAVQNAWFVVHQDSYAFRNEWIVENRWKGKIAMYTSKQDVPQRYIELENIDYPVTNMLLIADKK